MDVNRKYILDFLKKITKRSSYDIALYLFLDEPTLRNKLNNKDLRKLNYY